MKQVASINLLLVEDDYYLGDIYSTKLANFGFNVAMASDGGEADKLLTTPYDLVLMDLMLPIFNGRELMRKHKHQRYLIISNLDPDELEKIGKKHRNVVGSLNKSQYTPREICLIVKQLAEKHLIKERG